MATLRGGWWVCALLVLGLHWAAPAPRSAAPAAWILDLVKPSARIDLDQLLGRWYVLEEVAPVRLSSDSTCDWYDFRRNDDGTLVVQLYERAEGRTEVVVSSIPVLDGAVWHIPAVYLGYAVVDLTKDEKLLSVATCMRYAMSCTATVLSREAQPARDHSAMLEVHRRLAKAGLNHTDKGFLKDPQACHPESTMPIHFESELPPAEYHL